MKKIIKAVLAGWISVTAAMTILQLITNDSYAFAYTVSWVFVAYAVFLSVKNTKGSVKFFPVLLLYSVLGILGFVVLLLIQKPFLDF